MLSRVGTFFFLLALVFCGSRVMIRELPGDPLDTLMAETGTTVARESLKHELGLDLALVPSLKRDVVHALHGDLGISIISRLPVAPTVGRRLLATCWLVGFSVTLALAASLTLGLMASQPFTPLTRFANRFCTGYGAIAAALPTPWIGPVLIYLFSVKLRWLPVGGSIWLPSFSLALAFTGVWSRLIRQRVFETLQNGAAPGARARGLAEPWVIVKYGLAPASGALISYFSSQVGALMAGAFVTEVIFDWPGMGSLLVDSTLKRDYPMIEAAVFFAAAAVLFGNAAGDWLQSWMDPRLERD